MYEVRRFLFPLDPIYPPKCIAAPCKLNISPSEEISSLLLQNKRQSVRSFFRVRTHAHMNPTVDISIHHQPKGPASVSAPSPALHAHRAIPINPSTAPQYPPDSAEPNCSGSFQICIYIHAIYVLERENVLRAREYISLFALATPFPREGGDERVQFVFWKLN
jgi:hypothetical protein